MPLWMISLTHSWQEKASHKSGNLQVSIGIQNRIRLRMDDVGVFRIQEFPFARPRKQIVIAAKGKPIIADADDSVPLIDDAGSDLRVRILAAHGGKEGDAHEVTVPIDVISPFFHRSPRIFPKLLAVLLSSFRHPRF